MNCQEYREMVAAHVDNVLIPSEREEVEHHVAICEDCQKVYKQEKGFRAFMATKPLLQKVPPALEQNLRIALVKAEKGSWWSWLQQTFTFPRLAVGLATAGLLAFFFLPRWFEQQRNGDFLQRLAQNYMATTSPDFSLAFHTRDLRALEDYYNQLGPLDFQAQLPDLRKRGYDLKGGIVVKVKERVMTLTSFEGQKGYILCHLFRGTSFRLPSGGEKVGNHLVYSRGDFTIFFTREEKEVVCALVTRVPRERFLRDIGSTPS